MIDQNANFYFLIFKSIRVKQFWVKTKKNITGSNSTNVT